MVRVSSRERLLLISAKDDNLSGSGGNVALIQFLGATQTVTGSRHLLEVDGYRVLTDCGLFQGLKELRLRNWEPLLIPPSTISSVILTHAHIAHTGYLPRLVRD